MTSKLGALGGILLVLSSSACKKEAVADTTPAFTKEMPSFGGTKIVEVTAEGIGPTRNAAVLDALSMAAKQTNGSPIVGLTVNSNGSIAWPGEKQAAFGFTNETVATMTSGVIQGFEIVSQNQQADTWRVTVKAKLNKYQGSAAEKLPKLVIANPRTHDQTYMIGDQQLSASEASESIKTIVSDSIAGSNRFFLINRSHDDVIDAELAQITNGPSANQGELAKLGQRLTADILVLPEITRLAYRKSTRTLSFSGRSLNSYEGEIEMSFNVLNVATGQLIISKRYTAKFPKTPPSVYGGQRVGISDVKAQLAAMSNEFTDEFVLKNFPISVIQVNGSTVVLSQGEPNVHAGAVYDAVLLGTEIKDPQTGQPLGRLEEPIGTVRVIKVTDKMAIGQLVGNFNATRFRPGNIELRAEVKSIPAIAAISDTAVKTSPAHAEGIPEAAPGSPARPQVKKRTGVKDHFNDGFDDF